MEPKQIVNLKTIPMLSYIKSGKGGLGIGALTSLLELESSKDRTVYLKFRPGDSTL